MKIAVIGGGSTYTPELVNGLLERRDQLPVTDLWLMDVSQDRLDSVGKFTQRMVEAQGSPFRVHLTTHQRAAIEGASYVSTQIRVGGMAARRGDEYLGRRHNVIGQETTGIGGMAKAMRTIPVILRVARDIAELAPTAMLLNFTNPAGLVVEAVNQHVPEVQTAGVCNGPFSIQRNLLDILHRRRGIDPQGKQSYMSILGINHLSWSYDLLLDGVSVWDQVIDAYLEELADGQNGHIPFDAATIRAIRMIPSAYLQYFYYTAAKVAYLASLPKSRAETVMALEDEMLEYYSDPDNTVPPPELMLRGGAYYSTVATQMINAHYNDLHEIHVANVPHRGAVAGWNPSWVLEMPCEVSRAGVIPMRSEPLPPTEAGLMGHVKAYELLTVKAAVEGDRTAAYQAMLAHPLGPAADQIDTVLDDLLNTNRDYLPQFFGGG